MPRKYEVVSFAQQNESTQLTSHLYAVVHDRPDDGGRAPAALDVDLRMRGGKRTYLLETDETQVDVLEGVDELGAPHESEGLESGPGAAVGSLESGP